MLFFQIILKSNDNFKFILPKVPLRSNFASQTSIEVDD